MSSNSWMTREVKAPEHRQIFKTRDASSENCKFTRLFYGRKLLLFKSTDIHPGVHVFLFSPALFLLRCLRLDGGLLAFSPAQPLQLWMPGRCCSSTSSWWGCEPLGWDDLLALVGGVTHGVRACTRAHTHLHTHSGACARFPISPVQSYPLLSQLPY